MLKNMSLLVRQKNIRAGGRWLLMSALLSVGTLFLHAQNNLAVPDALVVKARQNHGDAAATRVQAWQQLLIELQGVPEPEQLKRVNDFFNSTIPYVSDMKHWKKDDYWATPYESLVTNGGDCEDYVIAKYHALRERSEEHTSELQSRPHLVCRLLLDKINKPSFPSVVVTSTHKNDSAHLRLVQVSVTITGIRMYRGPGLLSDWS